VTHAELNERQVRIILDAISLSTPEFFETSKNTFAKTKADEALQSLTRKAFDAFPNSQAADLFSNIGGGKVEVRFLKMYFDLSALPLRQRKASFRNASSNDKSDLWRTHLALFLAKRPNLNSEQKKTILAAMALITREHFGIWPSDSAWKTKVRDPLRSLEEQIVGAFSLEDAAKIFATIGDDTEPADGATYEDSVILKNVHYRLNGSGPYTRWPRSRSIGPDIQPKLSTCECSTESDYCPIWSYCGGAACTKTSSGCGTFWRYPCDGACH